MIGERALEIGTGRRGYHRLQNNRAVEVVPASQVSGDLATFATGMASGPTSFAPSSPHEGCIDAVRSVLNSWGFRRVGHEVGPFPDSSDAARPNRMASGTAPRWRRRPKATRKRRTDTRL